MTLDTLTDAELVRAMARAGGTYRSRQYSDAKAEAERRGRARVVAGVQVVVSEEDAKDRAAAMSDTTRAAVAAVASYLAAHPGAWMNTHLGYLLLVHAVPHTARTAIIEVRVALGLPEDEFGALADWSRGKPVGEVVRTLSALGAP